MLRLWLHDDQGATAIEYALVAAFMGLATLAGATLLGASAKTLWNDVIEAFSQAAGL